MIPVRDDDMATGRYCKTSVAFSVKYALLYTVELDVDWPFYADPA